MCYLPEAEQYSKWGIHSRIQVPVQQEETWPGK